MVVFNFPSHRIKVCTFRYLDGTVSAGVGGENINTSRIHDPKFKALIETPKLQNPDRQMWKAWKMKLHGGINLFKSYDTSNKIPLAYLDADDPNSISAGWDGTCNVSSIGLSGALGLSGLPANYQFKTGDPIGLEENGKYDYYVVVSDVTATGAGACTASVEPFLRNAIFTTAAIARIWQPFATFVIDPESWSDEGDIRPSPISFTGKQRI